MKKTWKKVTNLVEIGDKRNELSTAIELVLLKSIGS